MIATAETVLGVRLPVKAERPTPTTYRDPATSERMTSIRRVVDDTRPNHGVDGWIADAALDWTLRNTALVVELSREQFAEHARVEGDNARHRPADVGAHVRALIVAAARALMDGTPEELPALPDHLVGTALQIKVDKKTKVIDVEAFVDRALGQFRQFVADCRPQFLAVDQVVFNRRVGGRGVAGAVDLVAYLPERDAVVIIKVTTAKRLEGKFVELAALRRARHTITADGTVAAAPRASLSALFHIAPEFEAYRLNEVEPKDGEADDERDWRQFLQDLRTYLSHERAQDKAGRVVPVGGRPLRLEHLYDQRHADARWSTVLNSLRKSENECTTLADVRRKLDTGAKLHGIGPKLRPVVVELVNAFDPPMAA